MCRVPSRHPHRELMKQLVAGFSAMKLTSETRHDELVYRG